MKVLFVLADLQPSGAERMLACSFEHWSTAGIEPVIVGMSDGDHPFAPTLAAAGYEVRVLPDARTLAGLRALRRTLRTSAPEVVNIHQERSFDAVSLIAARSPSVRGIVRTVQSDFGFSGSLRVRRKVRMAFARALGVVWLACSDSVANTERSYLRRGADAVVENWIDVGTIVAAATPEAARAVRDDLGIGADADVLTLVGNCATVKNHELVASALAHVKRPLVILHVGSSAAQPESEAATWRALPDHHRVLHLGSRSDVPRLLAATGVFAFPSLYEGMPLAVAEAVCAGVPVLGSDVPALRWLESVPTATRLPLDPHAWAAAIEHRFADPPSSDDLSAAAAAARIRFDPRAGVAKYVEAYEAALRVGVRAWPSIRRPTIRWEHL